MNDVLIDLLEVLIKEKTRKAAYYAKLAAGETFEPKPLVWYALRKAALESEIEGHKNTILRERGEI